MRTRESLPFGYAGCPITGKRSDQRGFVDTGKTIRVGGKLVPLIVSVSGAHILGRHIGMLEREAASKLDEEIITYRHRIAQLEDELDGVNTELDGVDALVKNRGYVVRKAPGRKPSKKDEE